MAKQVTEKGMTREELIQKLSSLEWEDFEAKAANSELPKSVWETVSAFSNTNGGWIVLGVKQKGNEFEIEGVHNAEKLEQTIPMQNSAILSG